MQTWNKVNLTDKSGKQFFVCNASPMSTISEIKNLKKHIEQAKSNPSAYSFLDVDSVKLMLNDSDYETPEISDDELLAELGL